jgi:hypothetical protein
MTISSTNKLSGGNLLNSITNSVTSLTLTSGGGTGLPASGILTLGDPAGTHENIFYGSRSGDVLSAITRGYESSIGGGAAAAWGAGTPVYQLITAGLMNELVRQFTLASAAQSSSFSIQNATGTTYIIKTEAGVLNSGVDGEVQVVTFATPFPTACIMAHASVQVIDDAIEFIQSNMWFQLINGRTTAAKCEVTCQSAGTFRTATVKPLIIAIGY